MRRISFVLGFLLSAFFTWAQQSVRITDETIVKDSSGTVLTPAVWKALMGTGKYIIRPENPVESNGTFRLYRLTEEEIERREANMPKPRASSYFSTGKRPATFTAKDLEGNQYKLRELEGKVVVLNFWFVNCGPCRREIPELNKLTDEYKDSANIVFLAIALDSKPEVEKFIEKFPFNYKIVNDGRYIADIYKVISYPTHAVIDKSGKVIFHTSGYGPSTIPWLRKSIVQAMQ